jgi:hypothetical protein
MGTRKQDRRHTNILPFLDELAKPHQDVFRSPKGPSAYFSVPCHARPNPNALWQRHTSETTRKSSASFISSQRSNTPYRTHRNILSLSLPLLTSLSSSPYARALPLIFVPLSLFGFRESFRTRVWRMFSQGNELRFDGGSCF